ncbi:MAG: hypothetical protein ACT4QC_01890 [Planctomycetaceae bacterium]
MRYASDSESSLADGQEFDLDDYGATFEVEEFKAMGVNPFKSTKARPGTEEKVLMLSARYAAGLPLWHDSDCYEHGPHEEELMGSVMTSERVAVPPDGDDD